MGIIASIVVAPRFSRRAFVATHLDMPNGEARYFEFTVLVRSSQEE